MQGRNKPKEVVLASLAAVMVSMAAALTGQDCFYPPEACGGQEPFIRGDLNADGRVSISDQVFLRGLLFEGSLRLYCYDAADIIDDDFPDTCDLVALTSLNGVYPGGTPGYLFDWSQTIAPPFPDPGPDPTPDAIPSDNHVCPDRYVGPRPGGQPPFGCNQYVIEPAQETDDVVRLGDVAAEPGDHVKIPVFLTHSAPVEAVQLVVRYDPSALLVLDGEETLTYEGAYYEQFFGRAFHTRLPAQDRTFIYGDRPDISRVATYPDQEIFVAGIMGGLLEPGFEVTPGREQLIAWIHATVSQDVPAGTVIRLEPTNGSGGEGVGPYRMRNELTSKGEATPDSCPIPPCVRYRSILPKTFPGEVRVGIGGNDTGPFVRGDCNGDGQVIGQVADAVFLLHFNFVGGPEPPCRAACDINGDGQFAGQVTDAVYLLNHNFLGGPPPMAPFPDAGFSQRESDKLLGCVKPRG